MDAIYLNELRQLNESNAVRFESKVDQRFAEADARWERRMSEVRSELSSEIDGLRGDMKAGFEGVRALIAERETTLLRWTIGMWVGTLVGLAALLSPLVRR